MKKMLFVITFAILFSIFSLWDINAYAEEGDKGIIKGKFTDLEIEQELPLRNGTAGEITIQATDYIKLAQVSIYNNGSSLKISGHTDSYMNVDKISTTLYLQVWDSSRSRWVDYSSGKEFVKYGTKTHYNFIEFIAPRGYNYRTRGVHKVTMANKTETFTSVSNSIYYY